jgi:hypothetical protein
MTDFSITHYVTRDDIADTILSGDDDNILYVLDQLAQRQAVMPLVEHLYVTDEPAGLLLWLRELADAIEADIEGDTP